LNDITSRFAAMAERVSREETIAKGGTHEEVGDRENAGTHYRSVGQVGRGDLPVRPGLPAHQSRSHAIAYVSRLISDYLAIRRNPGAYKVGLTGKIDHLRRELALMRSAGKEGDTLARRWDFVVGDGRGGQFAVRVVVALAALMLLAAPASAGSYTVTTTPEQDDALAWSLIVPPRVLARNPNAKPVTPQARVQEIVSDHLNGLVRGKVEIDVRQEVEKRTKRK
jgi:hypothetical protein